MEKCSKIPPFSRITKDIRYENGTFHNALRNEDSLITTCHIYFSFLRKN